MSERTDVSQRKLHYVGNSRAPRSKLCSVVRAFRRKTAGSVARSMQRLHAPPRDDNLHRVIGSVRSSLRQAPRDPIAILFGHFPTYQFAPFMAPPWAATPPRYRRATLSQLRPPSCARRLPPGLGINAPRAPVSTILTIDAHWRPQRLCPRSRRSPRPVRSRPMADRARNHR